VFEGNFILFSCNLIITGAVIDGVEVRWDLRSRISYV